ncbi:MAG: hypothetical protein U0790_28155 [Isosphaeraceae bacterium]
MTLQYTRTLRPFVLGLAATVVALIPGCASHRSMGQPPDATRIAQRPTYPIDGTRPLFLGGYAGANYDPATRPSR